MKTKITKWQPDNFELEMTTHWSFPQRGDWATHDSKWRGNWSPYIPRNIMLRYSQEGDLVLDQFAGGGTTLVEAKLLNRDIIGIDINDVALDRCREKTAFDYEQAKGKVYIKKGDARHLDFIPNESIDLICTHPPYADIIKYSDGIDGDLSQLKVKDFLEQMKPVAEESYRVVTYSPAYASLRGRGFSLKYSNLYSINELSPCVPRFLFLFYANTILIPSFLMFTAAFISLSWYV